MKRTFLTVGLSALFSLSLIGILDLKAVKVIFIIAFIALFVFISVKKTRLDGTLPIIFVTVCCCCLLFTAFDRSVQRKTAFLKDNMTLHRITGEVISLPTYSYGRVYYTVKTQTVDGVKNCQKIRLSLKRTIEASPYDRVEGDVRLYKLGSDTDEIEKYYRSKGLYLGGTLDSNKSFKITKRTSFHPMYYVLTAKKALSDSIIKNIPNECGALLTGLLLGDKSLISSETLEDFIDIGSYHLLAVSGLHISVWAGFVYSLLNVFHLRKKLVFILSIAFILFFMALTGFNPPVLRAGILMIFVFLGNLSGKEADSLNSIGFAVTLMLLINPYAAYSESLWLSVFASFGIILLSDKIYLSLKRREFENRAAEFICSFVLQSLAVSIGVTVFTFPLTVLFFDRVSLVTPFSNLVLIEISSLAMLFTGFAALLYVFRLGFISYPLFYASSLLSKIILRFSHWLSSFERIWVSTSDLPVKILAVALPTAVITIYILKKKNASQKDFSYTLKCDTINNNEK